MARAEGGTINPKGLNDPRFNPEDDEANRLAHEIDSLDPNYREDERLDEVQSTVKAAIEEARQFYQSELGPEQEAGTDYYHGRPFGNELENRSQVVATPVRDVTLSQIPSLLRIIWNDDRAVEFVARRFEKEQEARQATDYVRYILTEDNPGFLSTTAVLKDGLVRKLGYWKTWVEEEHRQEKLEYTGLTEVEIALLANDEDVEEIEPLAQYEQLIDLMDGMGPQLVALYDVMVTRLEKEKRFRVRELPPEEVGWTPDAKDLESAPCVYHSREVPQDYLRARGFDEDLIKEALDYAKDLEMPLTSSRHFHGGRAAASYTQDTEALDDSQRPVLFTEAYILIDVGEEYGDGRPRLAERRRFDCLGPEYLIANGDGLGECVSDIPIVSFTPEPEPHTIAGLSNYDLLGDVQLIESQVERAQLDSLAEAVHPVTIVVAGEVNMNDLTKPDASRIVRVRKDVNNSIREQKSTFVGPDTMPVLAYYDAKIEKRTGTDAGTSGLDADALQSTEKQAAASVMTAKQQRIEMIARVYAEATLKPLYKKLLKLVCRHQNRARVVRLRGKYVNVDPRAWDATMDVQVNVALGQGTPQDRIALLGTVAASITQAMQMGVPFTGNVELRRVLGRATELAGYHDEEFWKPWGEQEEQQHQQMLAQQPPPPSPEMALVEVEKMKAEAEIQFKMKELELKEREIEMTDDRERDRTAHEMALKEREIEAKHAVDIRDAELTAQVAMYRAQQDAEVKRETAAAKPQGATA